MESVDRSKLVEQHLDVASKAAHLIYPRVKGHIEFEELLALANAGLAEAAHRYDPAKGAAFGTYAWYRVQGSIIDGLRKLTNMPRRIWSKLVALRAASEFLENRLERDQGAAAAGTPPAEGAEALSQIRNQLDAIRTIYMTSLEAAKDAGFDPRDHSVPPADVAVDQKRASEKLMIAIRSLSEKEQKLMKMHYWDGLNLLEAGEQLGISKSWASRMHSQVVEKLRAVIDE